MHFLHIKWYKTLSQGQNRILYAQVKTDCLQLFVAQVIAKAHWLSEFSSLEMLTVPSVGWNSCVDLC